MIDFKEVEITRKFIAGAFLPSSSKRFPNAEEVYNYIHTYIFFQYKFQNQANLSQEYQFWLAVKFFEAQIHSVGLNS